MSSGDILIIGLITIAAERITEIIVDSKISERFIRRPIKVYLFDTTKPPKETYIRWWISFLDDLLSCGYCTSMWVGLLISIFYYKSFNIKSYHWIIDIILVSIIIHGLSNLYHVLYKLLLDCKVRYVNTHDFSIGLSDSTIHNLKEIVQMQTVEQVSITTIADIQRILAELSPTETNGNININTTMDIGGNEYNITSASKQQSKRNMLISGLKIIKSRMATVLNEPEPISIDGVDVVPPKINMSINSYIWVDKFIKQWLGANRDGYHITWDLGDGYKYKYDIFEHKLTRSLQ